MDKKTNIHAVHQPKQHPVQAHPESAKPLRHSATRAVRDKATFMDKLFILLLVGSIVYIVYLYFQKDIIRILQMNPYVWGVFSHIAGEISKRTLVGLFYASFFGSLFFIFLPLELLFLYYLTLGFSIPLAMTVTLIGYLMGLCLDYVFGFIFGAKLVRLILQSKFDKFHNMIEKWGSFVVLFGNIIIFPIQPVSVVIGSAKYSFKKFFILSTIGLFIKLFGLVVLNYYFGSYIAGLVSGLA
jgi:membrane protein DedA with SNARE-associated domain